MPCHSNNPDQHSQASRHIGYILHHPYIWQHFQLNQYDMPQLRDMNEIRQAFAASVCRDSINRAWNRHGAPQRSLVEWTFLYTSHSQLDCL